jgi:hypothetical protein
MITCRAKVTPGCWDGELTSHQFFGQDLPMTEDGTYTCGPVEQDDGQQLVTGSIVCDPCYMYLMPRTPSGKALNHELPPVIAAIRRRQQGERDAERAERGEKPGYHGEGELADFDPATGRSSQDDWGQ